MSTQINANDNEPTPNIRNRKDVIILSQELECPCGRTKERAHCPSCGRIKLYGMADTTIALIPNTNDIIKDCKVYRCVGCGEKFNDIDWYFNCNAPRKIDWEATKKLQQENKRREAQEQWVRRIKHGESFDYNMRAKCRAETGFDPADIQRLFIEAKIHVANKANRKPTPKIESLRDNIDNLQAYIKDFPQDAEAIKQLEDMQQELKRLENEPQ